MAENKKPSPQELLKAQLDKLKKYQTFKLEDKEKELAAAKETSKEAQDTVNELVKEIADYKLAIGMSVDEAPIGIVSDNELITKLEEILTAKPGLNGKQIADAIGMYGVTGDTISKFYYKESQSTLKRVGVGLQTKYYLATEDDLEAINAAKEKDKAAKEAKAKADAAKAK